MGDGNQFNESVNIDRIYLGYHGIVGESNGSVYSPEHQQRVLLVNVGTCALTGNSTCLITFTNKKSEALDLIFLERKRAVGSLRRATASTSRSCWRSSVVSARRSWRSLASVACKCRDDKGCGLQAVVTAVLVATQQIPVVARRRRDNAQATSTQLTRVVIYCP